MPDTETLNRICDPSKKYEAIWLFDVQDGNPNGDPDAGNQPRFDPETRQGIVTDACQKRKIRNYLEMVGREESESERYKIFVEMHSILNDKIERGYKELGYSTERNKSGNEDPGSEQQQDEVAQWMRENFADIRLFGAVLSTGFKAGQVWGPIQIANARSFDPILPQSFSITRCAATNRQENKEAKTMGRKELIPYGLYRSYVFYNPHLAGETVTERDLELFWQSLIQCWEFDRSSARGTMGCRGLWVFKHQSKYGSAPAHQLFDCLQVERNQETPREFDAYDVELQEQRVPDGVEVFPLI